MARNIVQDVLPPDEPRSIRNLQINRSKRRIVADSEEYLTDEDTAEIEGLETPTKPIPATPKKRPLSSFSASPRARAEAAGRGGNGGGNARNMRKPSFVFHSRFILWLVAAVAVFVLIFAVSGIFSGAEISIVPRQLEQDISLRLTAHKDATSTELLFEEISLTKEETRTAEATGEQMVETKATGTFIIYNNSGTKAQTLVAKTRFENKDGLIYRISETVSIPGITNGKPGTKEVRVVADQAGAEYNIGLEDFTIPGFKNDPLRYKEIYARSKTAMTGGQKGTVKVVKEADVTKAREEMRGSLKLALYNETKKQIPEGYVLYEPAVFIDWSSLPNESSVENKNTVLIKERGDLHALIFKKDTLSAAIAESTLSDSSEITVNNLETLTFSLIGVDPRPWEKNSVQFTLKGLAHFVWLSDLDLFKKDILGQTTSSLPEILTKYPGIERTQVVVRPFWKKTFPTSADKILLKLKVDE